MKGKIVHLKAVPRVGTKAEQESNEAFRHVAASKHLPLALAALFSAVTMAFVIEKINASWSGQPEKAVVVTGGLCGAVLIAPLAFYLLKYRENAQPRVLALIAVSVVCVLLASVYLFTAQFYIRFLADIFIWSESDYVNDILKLREHYPIFSAQINNESFPYVPGSQMLTYFLAWLIGLPTSIPAYRAMQLVYTVLAAVVAFLCCRRLLDLGFDGDRREINSPLWSVFQLTGLFLLATNNLTNPFVHLLHNDALAQLATVSAYWLLLEYEATGDRRILWIMCLVPAVGFWVKQNLIIWAFLYVAYLLIFDETRSRKKILYFSLATFAGVGVSVSAGYFLWREDFVYWTFTVLGSHQVSFLRSVRHLLDVWVYFAAGLAGGAVLMEKFGFKKIFAHWLIWLFIISLETYTSGIAWMLNHIGPGSLIAGVWFFAAVALVWMKLSASELKTTSALQWLRVSVFAAILLLVLSGFGVVRVPVAPFDETDARRYVGEIEREYAAAPVPERALLDFGTWVYLPAGIVMKDRAATIGERGYSQTGDFSGIRERLESKFYNRILVRNFHSTDFWYDHEMWTKSSGIRQALIENYREIGTIKAVAGFPAGEVPYGFREVSILVPREQ